MKNRLWSLAALLFVVSTMTACDYNKDASQNSNPNPSAVPSGSPSTTLPPQNP